MRLFIAIHAMDACSIVRFRFDAIVTAEVGAARDVVCQSGTRTPH